MRKLGFESMEKNHVYYFETVVEDKKYKSHKS